MKFAFIKAHKDSFSVERMSKILGVSKQGFYKFLSRTPSLRERENIRVASSLKAAHSLSRMTYGHRRLYEELKSQGYIVNKKRVIRLMKINNIAPKYKKPFRLTTSSNHGLRVSPNILARDFCATAPNQKWVSDISYIPTKEGFLYLAVIIDLYSRRIVGMQMSPMLNTRLIIDSFNQAMLHCSPRHVLFHSDQGVQYASADFRNLLNKNQITQSMSRRGNCWDNAVSESFFGTLKQELMSNNKFLSKEDARESIFEYINVFYNRKRRHSTLGYLPPEEFEAIFYKSRDSVN